MDRKPGKKKGKSLPLGRVAGLDHRPQWSSVLAPKTKCEEENEDRRRRKEQDASNCARVNLLGFAPKGYSPRAEV